MSQHQFFLYVGHSHETILPCLCLELPVKEAYLPRPEWGAVEIDWQLLSPVTGGKQIHHFHKSCFQHSFLELSQFYTVFIKSDTTNLLNEWRTHEEGDRLPTQLFCFFNCGNFFYQKSKIGTTRIPFSRRPTSRLLIESQTLTIWPWAWPNDLGMTLTSFMTLTSDKSNQVKLMSR